MEKPKKDLKSLRKKNALFVFDMDSTLVDGEGIDEMARELGVYEKVAEITGQAMRGEIDFQKSLEARVALLKGLSLAQIDRVYDRMPLMPGAYALVDELHRRGHAVGIISGGFEVLADRYARDLGGVEAMVVNQLEFLEGACTGKVLPPIVDAAEKAKALKFVAQELGIDPEHTVAIGDGANDLLMLQAAAYGISFRGKPKLREIADFHLEEKDLAKIIEWL